ncbi:hypothetical protein SAMN06298226_1064 [Nitrosovibrio sp. Nv4]|nr:hypothetical protein SAMN06298226_1064 [Nitrosovibrio sp. Nv4]
MLMQALSKVMKGDYSPVTKHIVLVPLQSVYRRMQGYDYDDIQPAPKVGAHNKAHGSRVTSISAGSLSVCDCCFLFFCHDTLINDYETRSP